MAARKSYWGVQTWQGTWGRFSRKRDAQQAAKQQREADRRAGNKGAIRVVRVNPQSVNRARRSKNPVRIIGSVAGHSTGWIRSKATRVVKTKNGYKVEVKR